MEVIFKDHMIYMHYESVESKSACFEKKKYFT